MLYGKSKEQKPDANGVKPIEISTLPIKEKVLTA